MSKDTTREHDKFCTLKISFNRYRKRVVANHWQSSTGTSQCSWWRTFVSATAATWSACEYIWCINTITETSEDWTDNFLLVTKVDFTLAMHCQVLWLMIYLIIRSDHKHVHQFIIAPHNMSYKITRRTELLFHKMCLISRMNLTEMSLSLDKILFHAPIYLLQTFLAMLFSWINHSHWWYIIMIISTTVIKRPYLPAPMQKAKVPTRIRILIFLIRWFPVNNDKAMQL